MMYNILCRCNACIQYKPFVGQYIYFFHRLNYYIQITLKYGGNIAYPINRCMHE